MATTPRLPQSWYMVLALTFVAGVVLLCWQPNVPSWVQRLSDKVKPNAWSVLFGIYLVSITVTNFVLFYIMAWLQRLFALHTSESIPDIWSSTFVGLCESVMYPTALLVGKSEFIAFWLAIKVAAGWLRWTGIDTNRSKQGGKLTDLNEARRHFNRFLVGNALSIMAAVVTYGFLKIWTLT